MNGWELDELHNVYINTPTNNQGLIYESSTSLWKNKTIDKTLVGLGNVDNTSDANKPISTATQTALNAKQDTLTDVNFGTFVNLLTAKNTLVDADEIVSDDSADSNKAKKTSWLNVWNNFIKTKTDALYATIASVALKLDIASPSFTGLMNGTGTTQTGSSANGIVNLSQTWNTTGAPTGLLMNITNTASGLSSNIFDFQVGGLSQLRLVRNSGVLTGVTLSFTNGSFNTDISLGTFSSTATNGTVTNILSGRNFIPTSGTAEFRSFAYTGTINQTGGASGITRGLYVAPTLTSAFDFRAIEATNGSVVLPYATASATYAIKTSDYLLNFTTGTFTATLPTAVGCTGKHYIFKNTGSGIITIATTSSQTIDGVTTYVLAASLNKYVHVVSTGSNWIVIANN